MENGKENIQVLSVPVAVSSEPEQVSIVKDFLDAARKGSVYVAEHEAARLKAYFESYAQVIREDLAALQDAQHRPEGVVTEEKLSDLYRAVARNTCNAIMAPWMIVPDAFLEQKFMTQGNKMFNYEDKLKGYTYRLGFVQVFGEGENGSVSIPVLSIDTGIMNDLAPFKPQALFGCFQRIASMGNHDMQHHFSNTYLNPAIAQAIKPDHDHMQGWGETFKYWSDTDTTSFETWLMLNHQRVYSKQLEGEEGASLRADCEAFFSELARIGREISAASSPEKAHQVVDFLGTLTCFTMMRYLPLNHPLFNHAVECLRQADPDANAIIRDKDAIIKRVSKDENEYVAQAFWNYAAANQGFVCKDDDYSTLKKLDVLMVAPWVAHLLSPAMPATALATAKEQVALKNLHMIWAASHNNNVGLSDGRHDIDLSGRDGTRLEKHVKNGVLQKCIKETRGTLETRKYKDGQETFSVSKSKYSKDVTYTRTRKDGSCYQKRSTEIRGSERTWTDAKERYHRDNAPARISIESYGERTERWYQHGKSHRVGAPAMRVFWPNGKLKMEEWQQNDFLHRTDGPCRTVWDESGKVTRQLWVANGVRHRVDGPAAIVIRADDSRNETWTIEGNPISEVEVGRDGTLTVKWGAMNAAMKKYYAVELAQEAERKKQAKAKPKTPSHLLVPKSGQQPKAAVA